MTVSQCGGISAALSIEYPQFQALLRLLDTSRTWVKLSSYRVSAAGAPWDNLAPNVRALASATPEQCVWGANWPHSQMDPRPDARQTAGQFFTWVADTKTRHRILVDNPAALYGV